MQTWLEIARKSYWIDFHQEMIGEIDQDGNGCISFNEFLYLMTKSVHEDGDIEEEIREAFRVFDREGHGFITVPDLCQVLTTLGDKLTEGSYFT